jgi:O-antigen/teichoic acid export membrane protein
MMSELRTRAIRGVGWMAVQRWAVRATSFVTFAALSHLLTPAEIGVVALALAVIGIFSVLVDLGMTEFLVRAPGVDATTTSTVFWLQMLLAALLGTPVVVLAHPLAELLGTPELAPVLQVLVLLLPLYGAAAVPSALLQRQLSFAALAGRDVLGAVLGGVAGVTLAALGAGVWALVVQTLTNAAVSLLAVVAVSRWHPRLTVSRPVVGRVLRFGGPLLGVQVMQIVRDRADAFVIGAIAGAPALGVWTVATRLLTIVAEVSTSILDAVALPVFARLQSDRPRFRVAHRTAVTYSITLLTPALLVLAVSSPVLVPTLFGSRWTAAVLPTQVLCVAYAIGGLAYLNRPVLVAFGRVGVEFLLTGSTALLHVGVVLAAAPHGLVVVAWAAVGEAVVQAAAGAVALRTALGLRPPIPPRAFTVLACGAGAAGCAVVAGVPAGGLDSWSGLAVAAGTAVAVFAALLWTTSASLLRELGGDLRRLLPSRVDATE